MFQLRAAEGLTIHASPPAEATRCLGAYKEKASARGDRMDSWEVCQVFPTFWVLAAFLAAERVSLFRLGVTASCILGLP